jgi:chaperone LolA
VAATARRSRRLAAAAAVLLAAAAAAGAADGEHSPLLDAYLNEVRTLSADFAQTLTDADGVVLEESSGTLRVSRPGRFRWIYQEPYEQWLVADGLNVWSYDLDLEQVTVKAQDVALASTPALLLGGANDVLEDFRYEGSADRGGLTWVRLAPLDRESGFRHVELAFAGNELSRMVFLDNLEQTTVVTLSNVVVNEPIEPGTFEFEVPSDVDVVGTPAPAQGSDR